MERESLRRAVAHIGRHGDTDVFPFPTENHAFHDMPDEAVAVLGTADSAFDASFSVESTTGASALAPAGYTGFRWATQLDPQWNAYFLASVIEVAPKIEAQRISADVVHSHRFAFDDDASSLFVRDGYLDFDEASRTTAEDYDWVVITDIADFYQRVRHHRLENALVEIAKPSDIPSRIMKMLGRWSDTNSYGLPVGGPAARILSELLLDRTDKLLLDHGRTFHRYADDYRLFARTRPEAHSALVDLSGLLLRNEGLALSKAKTRVMSRAEFLSTFDDSAAATDPEILAELTPEQRDRRERARELLGLTLRFDPYSPTREADYEALKVAVERIDIVDLFSVELSKPRIDPRLTRRLLRALDAAEPAAKAHVCSSLVENLEVLAPLVPQVLQAIRKALSTVDEGIAEETRAKLSSQVFGDSHLFQVGLNRAFGLRVLADERAGIRQQQFSRVFDAADPYIQRDIMIAMARWKSGYWLSDKKNMYDSFHPWVQRALLMASYSLGDEGKHWRNNVKPRLSKFDLFTRDWIASKVQDPGWVLPL